jgi:hypothetical protein
MVTFKLPREYILREFEQSCRDAVVKDDDRNAFRIVRDHCGTQKSFRLHSVVKRHLMQTFAVFRNIFFGSYKREIHSKTCCILVRETRQRHSPRFEVGWNLKAKEREKGGRRCWWIEHVTKRLIVTLCWVFVCLEVCWVVSRFLVSFLED